VKEIVFQVQDTGIGIPSEYLSNLFERFSQADYSSTRQYGGTGLGLAICKGLTELMGGRIIVESQKDVGSKFIFYLPVKMQKEDLVSQGNKSLESCPCDVKSKL